MRKVRKKREDKIVRKKKNSHLAFGHKRKPPIKHVGPKGNFTATYGFP
jgi:hypothetical protein